MLELVAGDEPARGWFAGRIALPDYDTVSDLPAERDLCVGDFAFHLPDDTVRLHYFGPAHYDGDIVVRLEKRKVAFLGDLLFHNRFPWLLATAISTASSRRSAACSCSMSRW